MSHAAPARVWDKVGVDIFTFRDQDYLITTDYLSGYFEIDRLPSKRIADVIYCLKQQMARHGVPTILVSDNSRSARRSSARSPSDTSSAMSRRVRATHSRTAELSAAYRSPAD